MIDSQTLIDAEKLVLSQAMDGSQAFADLRDKGISRQTFSLPAHQQIWTALETVAGTGGTVDALTVIARLEAQGQLDAVGGHAGVVETATYGALARYKTAAALEMVTEAAKKHALLAFASRMAEAAGDQLKSAEEALDEAERGMSALRDRCGVRQTETIRGAVGTIIENLQWRMNNPGAIKGISSGYRRLDLTLDGLQPGAMIVLAARPGVGKTAALVNILTNICLEGTPVGMFFFGGDAQGDAVLASVDAEMWQPAHTDALIYLMYILFFVAIIATVVGVLFQFGAALKDNPGAALKSLIGLVILVAVVVISWTMGSEEPLVIPGYSGTENVPFWLKLTDMFLYSIYILFAGTVLAIIFSSIKKKLS